MAQAIEDSVSSQWAQEPSFCPVTGLSATSCASQPTAMESNGGASSYNFRPVVVAGKDVEYFDIRLASFMHQAWRPCDISRAVIHSSGRTRTAIDEEFEHYGTHVGVHIDPHFLEFSSPRRSSPCASTVLQLILHAIAMLQTLPPNIQTKIKM